MNVELVQVTTRDGVRLDGMYQAGTSGLAFCVVHGTGGNFYSSTLFDALGERLLQLGHGVLRVNTRGHDLVSTAVTAKGGRRLGAAYEVLDDCRHDLLGWATWLRERGLRVGLVGHSSGAVKSLYAAAHEPALGPECVIAISPPRLSYAWFCTSPEGPQFLETYHRAEELVQQGQAAALMDVKLPLPFVITAASYLEKYGPDERYNYLTFLRAVRCPILVTFGSVEAKNNMAFRAAAEETLALGRPHVAVETVAGADHFYTGVRTELIGKVETWLSGGANH